MISFFSTHCSFYRRAALIFLWLCVALIFLWLCAVLIFLWLCAALIFLWFCTALIFLWFCAALIFCGSAPLFFPHYVAVFFASCRNFLSTPLRYSSRFLYQVLPSDDGDTGNDGTLYPNSISYYMANFSCFRAHGK